jgi:hypothetical protein
MSSKLQKQDIAFINSFLNNYCVEVGDIYKLEGYLVGLICCNESLNPNDFLDYEVDLIGIYSITIEKFQNCYSQITDAIEENNSLKTFRDKYNPLFIKNDTQATKFARGFLYSYNLGSLSDNKFAELNFKAIYAIADHIDYELMHLDQNYAILISEVLKNKIDSLQTSVSKLYSLIDKRIAEAPYISNNLKFNNFSETVN